jgi:hypothetical protein
MRVFYFGCHEQAGHFMRAPHSPRSLEERREISAFAETNPWGHGIDGDLCVEGAAEGVASLNHKDGWTALSFWDHSVDTRGGSNSNFLAEGTFTFDEMIAIAHQHFPDIMKRFGFPVVLDNSQ